MKIERITTASCCGGKSITFKLDSTISKDYIDKFKQFGFKEAEIFTKSGILYLDSPDAALTGSFGSDKLQVKCKVKDCTSTLDNIEKYLQLVL